VREIVHTHSRPTAHRTCRDFFRIVQNIRQVCGVMSWLRKQILRNTDSVCLNKINSRFR